MLPSIIQTALCSVIGAWIMLYICSAAARCRALRGSLSARYFITTLVQSLPGFLKSSCSELKIWWPVAMLLGLATVLYEIGLWDVAAVTGFSALGTQLWRLDFPCVPVIAALLGWDSATVHTNRTLVLPLVTQLSIGFAFWGFMAVGPALRSNDLPLTLALFSGALIVTLRSLKATMTTALSCELTSQMGPLENNS